MFKHKQTDIEDEKSEIVDDPKINNCDGINVFDHIAVVEVIEEENVNEEDSIKIIDIDEKDETDDQEQMITNSTFINPSQFDESSNGIFFKCEICDFISGRKTIINDHKESTHNWCSYRFSSLRTI